MRKKDTPPAATVLSEPEDDIDRLKETDSCKVQWKVVEPCRGNRKRRGRRKKSYPMSFERTKRRNRETSRTRFRLVSETSNSEVENVSAVNGVCTRTSSKFSISSTSSLGIGVYESQIDYSSNDDRPVMSPVFDNNGEFEQTNKMNNFPSASSLDDLTVISTGSLKRKRHNNDESDSDTPSKRIKKKKVIVSGNGDLNKKLLKDFNGVTMTNGGISPQPLDLVWAKCRGYPPFPALVSAH